MLGDNREEIKNPKQDLDEGEVIQVHTVETKKLQSTIEELGTSFVAFVSWHVMLRVHTA